MRPLAQARQARAWDAVAEARKGLPSEFDGYTNLLKSFPGLVQAGGLGPALAFLKVKREHAPYATLYGQLSAWLTRTADPVAGPYEGEGDLLEAVCAGSSAAYRRATAEALAFVDELRDLAGIPEGTGSRAGVPDPGEGGAP